MLLRATFGAIPRVGIGINNGRRGQAERRGQKNAGRPRQVSQKASTHGKIT